MTFQELFTEWFEKNRHAWALKTQDSYLGIFKNHVFPLIGEMNVSDIKPQHVIAVVRDCEQKNMIRLSRRVCQAIKRAFSYAVVVDYVRYNPASDVLSLCLKHTEKNHPFLPTSELTDFFSAVAKKGRLSEQGKRAFLVLFFTALRCSEVTGARWDEINLETGVWVIPASRMKMREEHTVYLSDIVIRLLKVQKDKHPDSVYVFPSPHHKNKPMNGWTLNRACHHAGYGGRQVPHGFRHIFATYCYESNKWRDDAIETSLAHKIGGIKGVYNKAKYADERRKLMQWYANRMKIYASGLL